MHLLLLVQPSNKVVLRLSNISYAALIGIMIGMALLI